MKNLEYNGNNIVNLINSIKGFCSIEVSYPELDLLKTKDLEKYDNVLFFLVDGLGYNWITSYGKNSFLHSKLKGQINSVFPSTTSSSVTTINTGYSPSEHGVTAWNLYSKEAGGIIKILPGQHKFSNALLGDNINYENILSKNSFFPSSKKDVFIVTSEVFKNSKYNEFYNKNVKVLGYKDLGECFSQTINIITSSKKQKYIYTYWPDFDTNCHDYGIDSIEAKNHFEDLDNYFESLEKITKENNTLVIVTADHGQLNCDKIIDIRKYKDLEEMLLLPLAGEPRCQYCFVKKGFEEKFYYEIKKYFKDSLDIYSKKEILDSKIYGFGNDKKFLYRIGDFVILPKEGYILTDGSDNIHIGMHGGITDWETKIPLIYF